jgi:hypothetical protein
MKKSNITIASALLLICLSVISHAQVKTIQMKIAGYLCGN